MKTKFKHLAAAAVSAVITFTTFGAFPVVNAGNAADDQTYTLSYNISGEDVVVEDASVFESVEIEGGSSTTIADGFLERKGYSFSGWTCDGIYLYQGNDVFKMPEEDTVLEPVWVDISDENRYQVQYYVEIDGVVEDTEDMTFSNYRAGDAVNIPLLTFPRDGYSQIGWTDGTNVFLGQSKMIMPAHDVVLEPSWHKYYNLVYDAGCDDRIVGNKSYLFTKIEGLTLQLADSSRLVRKGFTLSGWECDHDGKIYSTMSEYVMPSCDVIFTAVWKPINYTVVFRINNGTSDSIKIQGETDTAIIAPEPGVEYKGYKFAGWSYEDQIYQPGEEFVVPGAMPGLGIMLKGVWVEQEAYDVFSMIEAREAYNNGEITAEELTELADFLMVR